MNRRYLPETVAYVRITQQSLQLGKIEGEVKAAQYEWQFRWRFRQRRLSVEPSLGRALIQEPLERFLERSDYQLEAGSDYTFTVRTKM
ncbi:MAG: DUF3146 family protein [Pleurocapsa sp. MO_192.B19]|nr:DUF3146 family protein [Pleurocapsa sp. MO_192.B19]